MWRVDRQEATRLPRSKTALEKLHEDCIKATQTLLDKRPLIVGRQVPARIATTICSPWTHSGPYACSNRGRTERPLMSWPRVAATRRRR